VWRHVRAVVLLPGVVAIVVPALILWRGGVHLSWAGVILGLVFVALGLTLVVRTIALFATEGRGTLAPWNETKRLVVRGPYRYVRNPMISGVGAVLIGESALFGSQPLFVWAASFAFVNAIYIPLVEEPGLHRRFGEDYARYRANVPRWFPRLRPWDPS
jgi:protein-S-isoprenylcysteine O-methyltransferase Ste14